MMSKAELRKIAHGRRKARTPDELAAAGPAIAEQAMHLPEVADAATVAIYLSMGTEPPTWPLVDALLRRGATVMVPVVEPDLSLEWVRYDGPESLATNGMGISEPTGDRLGPAALGAADVIVMPGLSVDHAGRRLGRGAACYDNALANSNPAARRVMLVFDDDVIDEVPVEAHDELVHLAVTPTRTVRLD